MKSSWMLVAGALFALMGMLVKLGAARFTAAELVFYRALIGLVMLSAMFLPRGSLATPHLRVHLLRGITGVISLAAWFYSITQLPLATAITLNFTAPVFVALFSGRVLGEHVKPSVWLAVLLGLAGVALLLKPTLSTDLWQAGLIGASSGVFAAFAYMNVRTLGKLGEPEWRTVLYFVLTSVLASAAWQFVGWGAFSPVMLSDAPVLLGIGVAATLAQLAMTRAYKTGETLVVGAFSYSTVVFSALLGVVFLGEALSASTVFAIAIIVAAGMIASRAGANTSRAAMDD